jgi:hypothetical protein
VQRLLGHKYVDTTLGYARLYDSTVAADYYRAMGEIEQHSGLAQDLPIQPPSSGEMLALLDALRVGTLNETQQKIVRTLRSAILALDTSTTTDDDFLSIGD